MQSQNKAKIKPRKLLGIETFHYPKSKLKSDINTYWREIYWRDNKYLDRYEKIYKNTL